jgi:HD superfamily phosphohydrolase YqeK
MNHKEYNGWTNYETWVVNLWIDNEEGTHDYWLEVAEDIYNDEAEEQKHFTKIEDAACILAERLKNDYEENLPEMAGVYGDLIGAALSEVNWREIAEHLLENVEVDA